jgi:hypothetical protein
MAAHRPNREAFDGPRPAPSTSGGASLARIAFSVNEAAQMLGKAPEALRREIERHAVREGDEHVAHLVAGIVARKRRSRGRWLVIVPPALLA